MQQDYTPQSFIKGQQFEQFVEQEIFTEDRYELISRTNSYEQNASRYAEDTLKPDFKFRCKETGKEFWVEAKYRSELYYDKLEALNHSQRERFLTLEKEEGIPVFVIIGYWGTAQKPNALSLIPLKEYKYIQIFRSFLRQYNLSIQPITNETLKLMVEQEDKTKKSQAKENVKEEFLDEKNTSGSSKYKPKYNSKVLGLAAVGLLAIILTIYGFSFSEKIPVKSSEDQLKEIVSDYYQSMNSNQIEKLPQFLSPQIDSWYGDKNPSQEEILRNAKAHRGKYPFSSSNINWDSFIVVPENTGGYHVSYEMIYKSKEEISDDYTVYDLKLITKWDENMKLKSIKEIRN